MAHIPHLYLPRPWGEEDIVLEPPQIHHLERVLRLRSGEVVSYTDGEGTVGAGPWEKGSIRRQGEEQVEPLGELELAVAPPHDRDRLRWLVEKAAELEVTHIRWLQTRYGNARPNLLARSQEWAVAALEQSRGAWLTSVASTLVSPADLQGRLPTVAADPAGGSLTHSLPLRVLIGPEGGWEPDEIPTGVPLVNLGRNILRTETAALVVAARYRSKKQDGD